MVTWSTAVVAPRSTCHCWGLSVLLCQTVPAVQSSALAAFAVLEVALALRPQARSPVVAAFAWGPVTTVATRTPVTAAADPAPRAALRTMEGIPRLRLYMGRIGGGGPPRSAPR